MFFEIQLRNSTSNAILTTVQMAMQDEAAFHAGMALFASERANIQGTSLPREASFHKAECVRIISSRLLSKKPPLDGTIGAVILLWAYEVLDEDSMSCSGAANGYSQP